VKECLWGRGGGGIIIIQANTDSLFGEGVW